MQWSFAAVGPRLLLKPPIFFDWKVRLKDLIVNGQTHARITFVVGSSPHDVIRQHADIRHN